MRRTGWGLALAVLCIGSMARAQFAPPGVPEPITTMPPATQAVPAPAPANPSLLPPQPAPAAHSAEAHGEEHHEAHEEHHGEEECHDAWYFDFEYLLVRPFIHGQDYAIVGTAPVAGPVGIIYNVEGGYESGMRVAASYRCPGECWDLQGVYTYMQNRGDSAVAAPAGASVFPTVTFPGFVTAVLAASAHYSFEVNVFDLEFGRHWQPCESLGLRAFIGPRFAGIDNKFDATYTGGAAVVADLVHRQVNFEGGGFRIGGEARWKFWENFGLYVRGSASLLTGWFHSELTEVADGATVVNVSQKFHKMAPVAELGLGISYQVRWLRVSAGYEFINWFGMDDGIDFTDDVSPGKYNHRINDLSFDGVVFRAELLF
jgi:hypothetical protein